MDQNEKHQILFSQLVLMFHAAAMQQMGKLKNPMTDKVERDLNAAQGSIEMLDMLRTKSRGNLDADETRLLDQVLRELRLNYVDEANKPEPAPPPADEGPKNP